MIFRSHRLLSSATQMIHVRRWSVPDSSPSISPRYRLCANSVSDVPRRHLRIALAGRQFGEDPEDVFQLARRNELRTLFTRTDIAPPVPMNRPGMSGDSISWKGWSHVRWFIEEVPARAA